MILHEVLEKRIFLGGEFNPLAVALYLLREPVQFQLPHNQSAGAVDRPAAKKRLGPHQELGECERFGQVVVGAGLEELNLILNGILSSEDQYRNTRIIAPDALQHLASIHPRQH